LWLVQPSQSVARCAIYGLWPRASSSPDRQTCGCSTAYFCRHHYLGHRNTVGENIRYLVHDRTGRPVGCTLFGKGGVEVRGARCLDRLLIAADGRRTLVS